VWVTGDDFVLYMGHNAERTEFGKDRPVLIPLDSDRSRLDMTAIGVGK
jgi:hypothetical protein